MRSIFKRALFGAGLVVVGALYSADRPLGDIDNDGIHTVMDLARQIAFTRGQLALLETERAYADVNRDGVFNDYDSQEIVKLILGTSQPFSLPLATTLETSPAAGETGVALTREFVLRFTLPLALDAVVTTHNAITGATGNLWAEFGGRRLLTRAELSSDRRKATLFFLEPLPASARVRVYFDPAGLKDILGRDIDPNGDNVAGGIVSYDFDTLSISALPTVGVIGTVYGVEVGIGGVSTKVPLAGVTISVDGAEQTLRTTTGADGKFVLSPVPGGRFFVLIDGRTAAGSGPAGYYAFVGKAWEGIPGQLATPVTPATPNTAAGDVYLPFIPAGTLQTVSASNDTPITFPPAVLAANPSLAGVQITVPANSLFADNGARGGTVGISPVAPDRLPEPLPPGLNLPLVITIQTDGATNFDRPVPVRFPNLPDPITGVRLAAGEKSALWSFDHDTGRWEIAGPMTVTSDGNFVESDPGVGVRQPGWHGSRDGSQGDGGDLKSPPGDDDTDRDGKKNGDDDDIDGDGFLNGIDGDMDGDGIPNAIDPDADGDGIPDDKDTNIGGPNVCPCADTISHIENESGTLLPSLEFRKNDFELRVIAAGGTFKYTSGYRSAAYQAHLYSLRTLFLALDALAGTAAYVEGGRPQLFIGQPYTACSELAIKLNFEIRRHELVPNKNDGAPAVNNPLLGDAKHTLNPAEAFDASIGGLTSQQIDQLADAAGLKRPYPGDRVHFELK